jgi:peptidoglycan/xylan/chitin deacetylase (PgdA/CDA1 family)
MPTFGFMPPLNSVSVPILMYHEITERPVPGFRKYCVTPKAFAAQMDWLVRLGYVSLTLDALREHLTLGSKLPPRAVVITFDDGFSDCVRLAPPVLMSRGLTATFFPVAGLVGTSSTWLAARLGVQLSLATWDALRDLVKQGFGCGGHGLTHQPLGELPPDTCRWELVESKRLLESELGRSVDYLAYPYGSYTPEVRLIAAEAGYRLACAVRRGLSPSDDDPLALRRVTVSGEESLADFVCRLRTGESVLELIRWGVHGVRRRLGSRRA